ncbi:MAG: hypothetical protein ACLR1R_06165 [Ruminococcus callidus]
MPSTGVRITSFAGNTHAAVSSSMVLTSSQSRRASASSAVMTRTGAEVWLNAASRCAL